MHIYACVCVGGEVQEGWYFTSNPPPPLNSDLCGIQALLKKILIFDEDGQ